MTSPFCHRSSSSGPCCFDSIDVIVERMETNATHKSTSARRCRVHKTTTAVATVNEAMVEYALAHAEAQASGMWS